MAQDASTINLSDSRQASLYAADIVTFVAAVISIALRLWSRYVKAAGLWIDDYFILAAMVGDIGIPCRTSVTNAA